MFKQEASKDSELVSQLIFQINDLSNLPEDLRALASEIVMIIVYPKQKERISRFKNVSIRSVFDEKRRVSLLLLLLVMLENFNYGFHKNKESKLSLLNRTGRYTNLSLLNNLFNVGGYRIYRNNWDFVNLVKCDHEDSVMEKIKGYRQAWHEEA